MKLLQNQSWMVLAVSIGCIGLATLPVRADDGMQFGLKFNRGCGYCISEAKLEKEKKTTFKVESKEICVPAVQFPWSKCKTQKCGQVKVVCELKKGSTNVEKCKYEWKVEKCEDSTCTQHSETETQVEQPKKVSLPRPTLEYDADFFNVRTSTLPY